MKYEDLDSPSTWRLPPPGTHPRLPPSPPFASAAESQGAQQSQVYGHMTAAIVACLLLYMFLLSVVEIYCCNFLFSLIVRSYTISRSCNCVSSSSHIWCSTTFEFSNECFTGLWSPAAPARQCQRRAALSSRTSTGPAAASVKFPWPEIQRKHDTDV